MQETTQRPLYVFMVVDKGIPSSQADEATFHNALQYLTTILTAGSGQREPPRLVLEVEGDFSFAGMDDCKVEVPPSWNFEVGDFIFPGMASCKVEVLPTSSTSLGFTLA